ncbi:MAG: hypothetical protein RIS09_36 [Actinomycetota bacterium]|jgi:UPF0755 protein
MKAQAPKKSRPWMILAPIFLLSVVIAVSFAQSIQPPPDFQGNGTGQVLVEIEPGDTLREIGINLLDKGVIAGIEAWIAVVNSDNRALSVAPGQYNLRSEMSARAALELLLDPSSRAVLKLTIPEGLRATEIIKRASKVTGIDITEFETILEDPSVLDLPAITNNNLEGFLFPATYEIEKNATAQSVIQKMVDRFRQAYTELELSRRAAAAGRSVREIIIIASILELEGKVGDYPKISRVIENRLKVGMLLQMDSTVNYALGTKELQLTLEQLKNPSLFNTYVHKGLPPGPIGNPGEAALEAALEPAPGAWLYFVTTNPKKGITEFAVTYEEFLELKRKFQSNVD